MYGAFFVFCRFLSLFVFVSVCGTHVLIDPPVKQEDTLVLKMGSLSMAPQADNPLSRTVLRKDIYQ